MTGRVLLVVVAVLVVTSGCVGLGGGDGPEAGPSNGGGGSSGGTGGSDGGTGGSSGGSGGSSGGGSSGDDGSAAGFQPVEDFEDIRTEAQMADYIDRSPFPIFRPDEYFVYEGVNGFGDEPIPVRMEIQSVEGGEWLDADLEVTLTRGEETNTYATADGSIGRIMLSPELSLTQNGRAWIWIYRYNLVTNVDPRISKLSVGDSWRWDSPEEEDEEQTGFMFEVTESRQYAGQSCLVVETHRYEGDETRLFSETCVATDVGMPLHYVMYQNDGEVLIEMELVEYRR